MNHIIYLASGDKDSIYKELKYSLLSLNKVCSENFRNNLRIIIYTDREIMLPKALQNLNIIFEYFTKQDVADWTKNCKGYFFIIKAKVMQKFLSNNAGKILFIDTDTFFLKDPSSLFNQIGKGKAVMHIKEHSVRQRPTMKEYLRIKHFYSQEGTRFQIDPVFDLWNSGVIGIDNSSLPQLEKITLLIEQLTEDTNWHILEQLSFSYYLGKINKIISADSYIIHYYFYKPFIHFLGSYFHDFSKEDQPHIDELKNLKLLPEKFEYKRLPYLLLNCLKMFSIREWVFYCLPANSFIGGLLRKELLFDEKYYKLVILTSFKRLFKLFKIGEFAFK